MTVYADVKPASEKSSTAVENCDVTVVGGAGHVGIPLVLALADAGLRVNINDTNKESLATLQAGRLPFIEHGAHEALSNALADGRLAFTSSPDKISRRGPVIITIGTPIDEFLNPVRKVVQDCIEAILPWLNDGQLVVLRSTVFPGTTDWMMSYFTARGRNLKLAFCPERVVQGNGFLELQMMPQIISGTTKEAEREAAELFERIVPEVVVVSPIEAELAKLFCNAYRYIEFAATNEFYLVAKSAGADYHRILKAIKHNYPRLKGLAGPGFAAGPCLVKDTMQLNAFARNQLGLGHAALLINEGLVLHVVEDLKRQYPLAKMAVGLLGMAFKAESDDTRASLSYKFKNVLIAHAREVLTTDPFVTTDSELLSLDQVILKSDLLIVCAPHSAYRTVDFLGKPVFDLWGHIEYNNVIR